MSGINDKNTCSSSLMCYLGSENKDKFVITAVKSGYTMLTKKLIILLLPQYDRNSIFLKHLKELC